MTIQARIPALPSPADQTRQWRIVIRVPAERTNLITNPSVETSTTGYAVAGGATVTQSATRAYRGSYSLAITPATSGDGVYFGTVSLTSGVTYAVSVWLFGALGASYRLSVRTTGASELIGQTVRGQGRWQRVTLLYRETSTTSRRIYLVTASAGTTVFYTDAWQVEACDDSLQAVSSYLDGDERGLLPYQVPPAYVWNGTPHDSTSTRASQTRAGGTDCALGDYMRITGLVGLGLAAYATSVIGFAQVDGGLYDDQRVPPRTIAIAGRIQGDTPDAVLANHAALSRALGRDVIATRQPVMLTAQRLDACGQPASDEVTIPCVYEGGLETALATPAGDDIILRFTALMPFVQTSTQGVIFTNITIGSMFSSQSWLRWNTRTGAIKRTSAGANGFVRAIAVGLDGRIFVGGEFTVIEGQAINRIAVYDPVADTWSSVGTGGANGAIYALAVAPDGTLYAGGDFTSIGGVAINRIAYWNGSTWQQHGTGGANARVRTIAVGYTTATGLAVYAGGEFTSIGGVAVSNVAYWNLEAGASWVAMASISGTGTVRALALQQGILYGAADVTAPTPDVGQFSRWNGTSWTSIATTATSGTDAAVIRAILAAPDGNLYLTGNWDSIGGVTSNSVARYTGTVFEPLGGGIGAGTSGLTDAGGHALAWNNGALVVGGLLTKRTTPLGNSWLSSILEWRGVWVVGVPFQHSTSNTAGTGSPIIYAALVTPSAQYYGGDWSTTCMGADPVAVTNPGTVAVAPTFELKKLMSGSGYGVLIRNHTTGDVIYLDMRILSLERWRLVLDPLVYEATSNVRGSLPAVIIAPSSATGFRLQPGVNLISVVANDGSVTTTNVVGRMWFPVQYGSLAEVP